MSTTPESSLFADSAFTATANFSSAIFQWIVLLSLAKFGTVATIGTYYYCIAVLTPVFLLFNMNLRSVLASDLETPALIGISIRVRIVASLLAAGLCLPILFSTVSGFGLLLILWSLIKVLDSLSDLCFGVFQRAKKFGRLAFSAITKYIVLGIIFFAVMFFFRRPEIAFLVYVVAFSIALVIIDFPTISSMMKTEHKRDNHSQGHEFDAESQLVHVFKFVVISLPLGVSALFGSLFSAIPRYSAQAVLGPTEVRVLSGLTQISLIGVPLVGAVCQAALPRLADYRQARDLVSFRRVARTLVFLSVAGGLIILAFSVAPIGNAVVRLITSDEFVTDELPLALICAVALLTYPTMTLGFLLISLGVYRPQMTNNLISTLFLGIFSLAFAAKFGLAGIAYAMVVVGGIRLGGFSWLYVRAMREF